MPSTDSAAPPRRRRVSGLGATIRLATILGLLAAACGPSQGSASPAPTASPAATQSVTPSSPSAAASPTTDAEAAGIYDAIEQQVIDIRGLPRSKPVERRFINSDELRALLTEQFDADAPADYLAAQERLLKALALIPQDGNLRDISLDLLSGGVAGFYRNDENRLYVVSKSGAPGPNERFYFAHEFDHALQDQNSTIFSDQEGVRDQGDRLLARQAIYEGDATLLMTQWAAAHLTQADFLEIIKASSDPEAEALLARTPAILRETLTFPYTTGFGYVQGVQAAGGWPAVNAYFEAMPESTEQILHPEKYRAGEGPVPVVLPEDLAADVGPGWSIPAEDTFGEFQLGIWLTENGVSAPAATDAAAGWGGDRLAVLEGPDDAWAVVMDTRWDTTADAVAFEKAATTALASAGGTAAVLPGGGGRTRWIVIAADTPTLEHVAGALGLAG